jgi:hypothetical protein
VSNAGGFHGKPNYFDTGDDAVKTLSELVNFAVNLAEYHDFVQSSCRHQMTTKKNIGDYATMGTDSKALEVNPCGPSFGSNALRKLEPAHTAEAWININQHGHWNRLHTHEGAVWSGVYYMHSQRQCVDRSYSGRLLLKPTPHITENTYRLTPVEIARLNCFSLDEQSPLKGLSSTTSSANETAVSKDEDLRNESSYPYGDYERPNPLPSATCCDYLEISPEEGTMIIFPSWLHHGVLPLSIKDSYKGKLGGLRISLAFNFSEDKSVQDHPVSDDLENTEKDEVANVV